MEIGQSRTGGNDFFGFRTGQGLAVSKPVDWPEYSPEFGRNYSDWRRTSGQLEDLKVEAQFSIFSSPAARKNIFLRQCTLCKPVRTLGLDTRFDWFLAHNIWVFLTPKREIFNISARMEANKPQNYRYFVYL